MKNSPFASPGSSVRPGTRWTTDDHERAQRVDRSAGTKIGIIMILLRRAVSEIKLKRTDTTLDLSNKAKRAKEKKRRKAVEKRATRDAYI